MLTLATPRLTLVATTRAHLDAELAGAELADVARAATPDRPHPLAALLAARVPIGWPPGLYDADAVRHFRERLATLGDGAVGWFGWYALWHGGADDRTLVAAGGYFGPPDDGAVEIGYSVVESYRGRGIATELIAALVARAFDTPGVDVVRAHTLDDNVASQRALLRAGFVRVGAGAEPGTVCFERRAPSGA